MPITDLLFRMQASRIHMALVIDEYGGTDGLGNNRNQATEQRDDGPAPPVQRGQSGTEAR